MSHRYHCKQYIQYIRNWYIYIYFIYISELGNGYMIFSQNNVSKKHEIYSDENNFSSTDGMKGSLKGNKIFFHVCLEIY